MLALNNLQCTKFPNQMLRFQERARPKLGFLGSQRNGLHDKLKCLPNFEQPDGMN